MRLELPSGTVTFLFTDVEGSTRLLRELGEGYAGVLAEHHRVLRGVWAQHRGVEVDTAGDAFFVAFGRASDAVAAAAEAQLALADGPVRVRMGVHTGEPLVSGEGYVGMDVHRAARIAAAGHGGQILVSAATAGLVDGSGLRSLGEHRFKDLAAAEPVYQIGELEFPPIRSLQRTSLPVPATPFVGRSAELAELAALLAAADARLVTVTGPGGAGKTRLALQAAAEVCDEFPDGVFWVALASLRDPSAVESWLAQALEVVEKPGLTPLQSVVAALADRRALLVVDNCEHLIDAVSSSVARVLEGCRRVVVVCSSRERFGVRAERLFPVQPMAPADGALLFAERARAVEPGFAGDEHVAAICEAVDELPLAIELAAARVRILSTQAIRERLSERLPLLTSRDRDLDERQRTLEATIGWSYDLLSSDEQRALRGLSVFAGGCTLEAALAVADADLDLLESLADKSLLRHRIDEAGQDRYWLLETIREFAASRLTDTERDQRHYRHREYYAAQAPAFTDFRHFEGGAGRVVFKADRANYRLVLQDAVTAGNAELALALVASLRQVWSETGQIADGYGLARAALALAGGSPITRARALDRTATTAADLREYAEAERLLEEAAQLATAAGDPRVRYEILTTRSFLAGRVGDYQAAALWARRATEAVRLLEAEELELRALRMELQMMRLQAMDRPLPDRPALEHCLAIAEDLLERSRALGKEAIVQYELATIYFGLGRYADSLRLEQDYLSRQDSDSRYAMFSVLYIALVAGRVGDHARALTLATAAQTRWEQDGYEADQEDARHLTELESNAQAALGNEAYEQAVRSGRSLAFDDAVEQALALQLH